ncbi:hypothetical protein BPA01_44480 [Brevibacillus parabrevis]|uniref:Uncharacterized protein n=1 Tax=Brevibacillus parabrevis TaxID=54914 RepID=A0A4Y3PTZ8_BREPA|nr:hypothetical protein BPA01_44480 [Brevibacillus parabrevis]
MIAIAKFVVNIATMLPSTKIPRTSNMAVLRFTPENNNGIVGPEMDTASAKRLTSHPALDILI